MKEGQKYYIKSSGSEGYISTINKTKDYVTINWTKLNNKPHNEVCVYTLQRLKELINNGTIKIYSDLTKDNPNLLFSRRK